MEKKPDRRIARFQSSLPTLRKVAGWSAEDLANKLDLTRQSIVNLETRQTTMTKVQYIAFRSVLEEEASQSKNETLEKLIQVMVDQEGLSDEDRDKLKSTVDTAVSSVGRRSGSAAASQVAIRALLLAGTVLGAIMGSNSSSNWLKDLMSGK